LAATSSAGASRNFSAFSSFASSVSTARRRAPSPAQACSRKAARRLASTSSAASYTFAIFCQRSGSIKLLAAQLAEQPTPGELPVAQHGVTGDLQDLGRFLHAETAEEA